MRGETATPNRRCTVRLITGEESSPYLTFGVLAVGQREAYRGIIVQRLRLPAGKPIPQHGNNFLSLMSL